MSKACDSGVSVIGLSGMILAALISWSMWQSVGWTIVAMIFSWFYVIYWAIKY